MAGKGTNSIGSSSPTHHQSEGKVIPNYPRASTDSGHHACKYGGKHTFEEKEACKAQPKLRKKMPIVDNQRRMKINLWSLLWRRVGDVSKPEKSDKVIDGENEVELLEWKDIVAYDTIAGDETSWKPDKIPAKVEDSGESKKKEVIKGKKSHGKAEAKKEEAVTKQNGLNKSVQSKLTGIAPAEPQIAKEEASPPAKNSNDAIYNPHSKRQPPNAPRPKEAAMLSVETKPTDQEVEEQASAHVNEEKTLCPLEQGDFETFESIRPISVHRKAKSMSVDSRSVHFPFVRQTSKNVATSKLRSRSSKAADMPSESGKPARLRSRRGRVAGEEPSSSTGIQLRIRSLRRRGINTGFVMPTVASRHQKMLEKKRSQRLYNNLIEETASKLVKTRKSRVKALVGAFETLITKVAK